MNDLVREFEELSFRTLPAVEQERYDGWVLRWSQGGSRRGNSVNPIGPSSLPLDEKVQYCEGWFARREAACVFRLTPLAEPELAVLLENRAYAKTSPTDVLVAEIGSPVRSPSVLIMDRPSSHWLRLVTGLDADSPEAERLAAQLSASDGQLSFASTGTDLEVLAVGMSVDLDRYTTIYNMTTVPEARRRGHARAILNTLLAIGQVSGSTHAVLQVTQDNTEAQALYRRFGFTTAYEYAYMEPTAQG